MFGCNCYPRLGQTKSCDSSKSPFMHRWPKVFCQPRLKKILSGREKSMLTLTYRHGAIAMDGKALKIWWTRKSANSKAHCKSRNLKLFTYLATKVLLPNGSILVT